MDSYFSDDALARLDACTSARDVGTFVKGAQNSLGRAERAGIALGCEELVGREKLDGRGAEIVVAGLTQTYTREESMLRRMRIAGILSWNEDPTDDGDNFAYSTADRLVCALSVLNFHYEPRQGTYVAAQAVVNDILTAHPNLFHPRFLVPHRQPGASNNYVTWRSVLTMLAAAPHGMLPCETAGATKEQTKAFVQSKCIMAGFINKVPTRATVYGRPYAVPIKVEEGGKLGHEIAWYREGSIRPRFWTSLLELGRLEPLSKRENWPTHPQAQIAEGLVSNSLLEAVCPAAGIAISEVGGEHERPSQAFPPFLAALARSGLLELHGMARALPEKMSRYVLQSWLATVGLDLLKTPAYVVQRNADLAMDALQGLGLATGRREAAQWLYDEMVGEGRPNHRALPTANRDGAMGFLQAVMDAGAVLPPMPREERQGASKSLVGIREAWLHAHELMSTKQSMEETIKREAVAHAASGDSRKRRAKLI